MKIGFGSTVDKLLKADDKAFINYYQKLKVAEEYALRKKLGVKYYIKPTKRVVSLIGKQLGKLVTAGTKSTVAKVPKLAGT